MSSFQELAAQIIDDFGATLDQSTILAIVSDYDLADPAQLKAARSIFEDLEVTAREEEDSGFDASASSGVQNGYVDGGSGKSLPGQSSSTDDRELTYGVSSSDIDGSLEDDKSGAEANYIYQLDVLDQQTKELMLVEMFPGLKELDITWMLKKAGWDLNRAINDLMTQSFMEENGERQKGIDGFYGSENRPQSRRAKGKKKKPRAMNELTTPITPEIPTSSKWDTGTQDVDFIATRTGKSTKEVGSLYHKNGASIRATVIAILDAQAALKIKCKDPLIESSAIDLGHEFPTLPRHLLLPLADITHPSTSKSHELAEALVYKPSSSKPGIQIEFRHAPIEPEHESIPLKPASTNLGLALETATGLTNRFIREREEAFTQARAAYHKGRSDHLMGGAAAYYSELGRDADARLKSAQSARADALAASQSKRTQLDLHGITVQDGKRIAKERVTNWWHELGETRLGRASTEYSIVTGVGHHSEGGRSKLGPAVLKMLLTDGWKVKVETGVLVVTGVAKRK